jgi:hypothetical protein
MRFSHLKRIIGATALALALSPLVALAQSPGPPGPDVCVNACRVEYDNQLKACSGKANEDACDQAASAAYTTCLAICPADKQ